MTTILHVGAYERRHRQLVLDLLYNNYQTHLHLDWYSVEQWLDLFSAPVRLAWEETRLVGAMGISKPMVGTSWLRLVIVRDTSPTSLVLRALWDSTSRLLADQGAKSAWILASNDWLIDFAPSLGFERAEMVVTLHRNGMRMPPEQRTNFVVQPAEADDITIMSQIDQQAFAPPWQLSQADLWQALRISALCNTAWDKDKMVGYQLSTRHREAGHLARLAVLPEYQGQGFGSALVRHMIEAFGARSVRAVTVNTQLSNIRSQQLYEHYGFKRNGYDMPVWKSDLAT